MDKTQTRELFHSLKNDFASMAALINLHKFYADKVEPSDLLDRILERQTVRAVAYEKIYQNDNYPNLDFKAFTEDLLAKEQTILSGYCSGVSLRLQIDDFELEAKSAIALGQIIVELVSNSYRHAFPDDSGKDKKISVSVRKEDGRILLEYMDNGTGLPAEVRPEKARTLGMQFIKALTRQLGTSAVFSPNPDGNGLCCVVKL